MSPPKMRNGGPLAGSAAAKKITTATKPQDRDQSSRLPRVRARALAPCGRRTLPVMVVPAGNCPWCPGSHVHRGGDGVRTAGCCSREYYLVGVPGVSVGRAAA